MTNNYNGKKHYAIKQQFDKKNSGIPETSGIYLWTRYDRNINKTFFYVGQAKNLRNRRFDYYKIQTGLSYPARHFEASLKSHEDGNYQIVEECDEKDLDEKEKKGINHYMKQDNYITRNDSLTGSDITRTNANRIGKIKKEYEQAIQKCLKNLRVFEKPYNGTLDTLIIQIPYNKDNTPSKKGLDAYKTLKERLGIKNEI